LKLLDRFVNEFHLFICGAHVVVGLEVLGTSIFLFGDSKLFKQLCQTRINAFG